MRGMMMLLLHLPLLTLLAGCEAGYLFVKGKGPARDDDSVADDTDDTEDTSRDSGDDTDDTGKKPEDRTWRGTGADGDLEVLGSTNLSEQGSNGRSLPDMIGFLVTGIEDRTVTSAVSVQGIEAGDEILLLHLQGSADAYGDVGLRAFAWVESVNGSSVVLEEPLATTFSPASGQVLRMQRVPQYNTVTVTSGSRLSVNAWQGSLGGVLAFRARERVVVNAGGEISVSARGYRGGDTGSSSRADGYQGESLAGQGIGGGSEYENYNYYNGARESNLGGGGCYITGAGGEHAGGATDGEAWSDSVSGPEAGSSYGAADLARWYMGSGGGGVWNGSGDPGNGGRGGGVLFVATEEFVVESGGEVSAEGEEATHWAEGRYSYGAGGGAGGTLYVMATTFEAASGSLAAVGGPGEDGHDREGGDGGLGRIRIDCGTCNGFAAGSSDAISAMNDVSEPDPGQLGTPR